MLRKLLPRHCLFCNTLESCRMEDRNGETLKITCGECGTIIYIARDVMARFARELSIHESDTELKPQDKRHFFLYNIRFGVELEGFSPLSPVDLAEYLRMRGIPCVVDRNTTSTYNDIWKVTQDGSLQNSFEGAVIHDPDKGRRVVFGVELVSPPLKGEADIQTLQKVFTALEEINWEVDSSCGTHVHIEVRQEGRRGNYSEIGLMRVMANMEYLLIKSLPKDRAFSRHARPIETQVLTGLALDRGVIHSIGLEDYMKCLYYQHPRPDTVTKYNDKRYTGLNMHSMWYRGTVEFRYFPGVKTFNHCMAYVYFCAFMKYLCNEEARRKFLLGNMLVDTKGKTRIATYLMPLVYQPYWRERTAISQKSFYSLKAGTTKMFLLKTIEASLLQEIQEEGKKYVRNLRSYSVPTPARDWDEGAPFPFIG